MRRFHPAALLGIIVLSFVSAAAAGPSKAPAGPKFALSEPSLSPEGSEIAFVSGGDIWTVPVSGGEARLLVAHPATELRPLYSPDGKSLAFTSTRTGNGDVYVLTLASGEVKRLTYDDAFEPVEGWSPDSKYVYFSSNGHDIAQMSDIYRVNIEGGTPIPVSADRFVNEFFAAPAPDGKTLAFSARGIANGQWWRNGHSHLDESEIWTATQGGQVKYTKLVSRGAKNLWPMWDAEGRTLYFMSDRSGAENIWSTNSGQQKQITHFKQGRVLWPSIARNGRSIVFERNFGIWKLDLGSGTAAEVPVQLRGVPAAAAVEHAKFSDRISEFALSPDGKKVVFAVHGELFAASAKDGGDGIRLTHTEARESQVAWAPDSKRIVYVSDREGSGHLYLYDFTKEQETQLTQGSANEELPRWSPDGKLLAYLRNRNELVVYNVAERTEKVVATSLQGRWPGAGGGPRLFDWSPDSKWLAFLSYSDRMFRNASVAPASGGQARPVSFLANVSSDTISWSPDGKYLLLETSQRTEDGVVARIDLVPHTPKFREDEFRDLFKEQKPAERTTTPEQKPAETEKAKEPEKPKESKEAEVKPEDKKGPAAKPTQVVFDGIRERLSVLPVGVDIGWQTISPDGKWLAVVAEAAGQQNIYVYSLDELAKEPAVAKQLTSTPGSKGGVQFTPDSKEIFYLERGKISSVALDTPKAKPLAVTAEMDVDFASEKSEVFEEAWRYLREGFFDASMNGTDWKAVHDEIAPYAAAARNSDDLRRIISLMIGELNASHSGISAPFEERKTAGGRLGVRFDAAEYEGSGRLQVAEVIDLGPAAVAGIKAGDVISAVEGKPIRAHSNFDQLLEYTIGKRVALSVESPGAAAPRIVTVKPVNLSTEKKLMYRQWVKQRRDYVEKMSNGKLGYVHMADMSQGALTQLTLDLDAENYGRKGVIVDVRNNNGGFVNAYALDVLTRRPYLNMTFRGFDKAAPARTILGQRSLELPTVLVTNQHSLSDAEDFTEGYRTLGLGKVVGEPTAGWIIYTGGVQLIDGSMMRMPHIRVTDHEGKPMEMYPRQVDFKVENAVGETYSGKDSQLDTAIKALLDRVEGISTKVAQ